MASNAPRFSLVVPTLRRADTLRFALTTLLAQDSDNFEVVVQNNGHDGEVDKVVNGFASPRIRLYGTDAVLPMTENWEMVLANTRGEFVTFIGDDDGLFPDACKIAADVIDETSLEIVSWYPYCYNWPKYVNPDLANRLVARVNNEFYVDIIDSGRMLYKYYGFAIDYAQSPMIYNSFVRRSVLGRAIRASGRYFLGQSPDVTSGIVNAIQVERFGRLSQPLSMTGLSQHSTGHNLFFSSEHLHSSERYRRDFSPAAVEPRLVESDNLQVFLARDALGVHDRLLKGRGLRVDFTGLIESVAAAINDRPESYEKTMDTIRALASIHQVDLGTISIPAKIDKVPPLACGVFPAGPHAWVHVVDGDEAGLNTIADAIRFVTQRIGRPNAELPAEVRTPGPDVPLVVQGGDPIEFWTGADGLSALCSGWSAAEDWGTWSVGKRARLTLRTEPERNRPLTLRLKFRLFLHTLHPEIDIVCRSRGKVIGKWRGDLQSAPGVQSLDIPAGDIDAEGRFELELLIGSPCAPSQLGLSPDKRLLGIGIESVFAPL